MPESLLGGHLAAERSEAVRHLLASPLLPAGSEPDAFRLVARHAAWLVDYFERTCGWVLTVDAPSGFARLAKRAPEVDVSRPLKRTRGVASPFDRRRYQLLCLICAELVRHPVTTVGLLAAATAGDAGLDTSRHGERAAFVDALRALIDWGALDATAGEVDSFVDSDRANALLSADTAGCTASWSAPPPPAPCPARSTPRAPSTASWRSLVTEPFRRTATRTSRATRPAPGGRATGWAAGCSTTRPCISTT